MKSLMNRLAQADITESERVAIVVAITVCKDLIANKEWNDLQYGTFFRNLLERLIMDSGINDQYK